MRILVISQYYYPEQFRVTDICEELVKRGHDVTVVTGLPNYPEGEIYPGYKNAYRTAEVKNNVRILRCNLRPRHKGVFNLMLNYLSFVVESIKLLSNIKLEFDVIYVYEISPITLALPGIWYKKRNNIPIYLYCLDIWPECVRDAHNGRKLMSKKNFVFLVSKFISCYIYNNVDLIGNKTEGFFNYLENECHVNKNKMKLLHEHAEDIYLTVPEIPVKNDIVDFVFLGNIGSSQNCELFVNAFKKLKNIDYARIHFVGDGSNIENLKKLVSNLELENYIYFHGQHSLIETMRYYELADCCIMSLLNDTDTGITPPGKLYGYMAASRPVLAAIGGDSKSIIEKANCGWCMNPNDLDGLCEVMDEIICKKHDLIKMGKNGRDYFLNNFTLDKHVTELVDQLNSLISNEVNE